MKVGSPLSVQSLVEDLAVVHATIKRWLGWLESLFFIYTVTPYTRNMARALRKQPKPSLWNWSEVGEPSARFENLVAGRLRKACDIWNDAGKGIFRLHYLRDKEKREVDFLMTRDRRPWLLAECKLTERTPAPALRRFAQALREEIAVQIVAGGAVHEVFEWERGQRGYVVAADRFLGLLP
jgi:predicted AAA+ superfamily ATPase